MLIVTVIPHVSPILQNYLQNRACSLFKSLCEHSECAEDKIIHQQNTSTFMF